MQYQRGVAVLDPPLTALYTDVAGNPVDPVAPTVDIYDALGQKVVDNAVPVRDTVGAFHFVALPLSGIAPLGNWQVVWKGVINGFAVQSDENFDVVEPSYTPRPAGMDGLIKLTRDQLQDRGAPFVAAYIGDGAKTKFELPVRGPIDNVVVVVDGVPVVEGTSFILDHHDGMLTFVAAPAADVAIAVTGDEYRYFTDDEVQGLVEIAFTRHTNDVIPVPVLENPGVGQVLLPEVEKPLVAMLAAVEGLWELLSGRIDEINVVTPEGVTIPRDQLFQHLLQMLQMLETRYKEISAQLGVGLYRIEMKTLRRVSPTTGRLVPLYRAREFDDNTPPVRVYPPIDSPA